MASSEAAGRVAAIPNLDIALPRVPSASIVWNRAVVVASILVVLFTLDRITYLLGDYWLLQSLNQEFVFWTNFKMGAWLYVIGLVVYAAAGIAPVFFHDLPEGRKKWIVPPGILIATLAAYFLAMNYHNFLFGVQDVTFGQVDPVFGKELGFYVFDLPYYWVIWRFLLGASLLMLISSIACAWAARSGKGAPSGMNALGYTIGAVASPVTRIAVGLTGFLIAAGVWLGRYDLLTRDNKSSSIPVGAEYLDVTGLFSTLNYVTITTLVVLGVTGALVYACGALHKAANGNKSDVEDARDTWRTARKVILIAIAVDFTFMGFVELRDMVFVQPNEPVVQLEYIARHIDATRTAYDMNSIEEIEYLPNVPGDPVPSTGQLLNSPTLQNMPLWPGFVSYLERLLDPQHSQRVVKLGGDDMIYGPTLDIFQQQQKLRTYYRFINIDYVRYNIDGEKKMFVSAVRELPLYEPVPWLHYWGQRFMLFTHGFGLVMAEAGNVTPEGDPDYVSHNIPSVTNARELTVENERIYYGEGASTIAFTNVDRMKELDYPTEQDRAEMILPEDVNAGVRLDSMLKRIVFGWRSGKFANLVFSDLINDSTRTHFYRRPMERLQRAAPFLYYDSNPYAVVIDGRIVWMVNALTTSNDYPYSMHGELGDKSDERSPFPTPNLWANYVEDSVKASVDAYTGEISFFKISDGPVIETWASIYPGLFKPETEMPDGIRAQLTYPMHLFHVVFDDLYIFYHMQDPMYFFNQEDMWDDGDEVLGPIMDSGKAITFSIEPYPLLLETGVGGKPSSSADPQYSMVMVFTPERALNLRAIPVVYQDWPDYGKRFVLTIPKGTYFMGPEQADAAIDQDPEISQRFALWTRQGMEVIRGHTSLVPIGNEIVYVEPIFLRSQQNPLTQLKRVIVVFREQVAMAETLEAALRQVMEQARYSDAETSELAEPAHELAQQ